MALFSEFDWVILLGVAAFLLFGQKSGTVVREIGRWYGRAMRLKGDLLGELRKAADLPTPSSGATPSIRATLFAWEPRNDAVSSVTTGPTPAYATATAGSWSVARPPSSSDLVGSR
ncbi:MAG: hypothetical protein L3K15_03415 [Thermoplasmata archaeon]|nr:hypothetical protein [Thermoplasmata archaeon]